MVEERKKRASGNAGDQGNRTVERSGSAIECSVTRNGGRAAGQRQATREKKVRVRDDWSDIG